MPEMAADASANAPDHDEMPAMSFLDHLEELRKRIIYSLILKWKGGKRRPINRDQKG